MSSLRCTLCAIDWPNKPAFNPCPSCEEPTFPVNNHDAEMTMQEALSMKKHFSFERFYERWDGVKDPKRLQPTADDDLRFPFDPALAEK